MEINHDTQTVMLDSFYLLKYKERAGSFQGEVIRQDGEFQHNGTHLFDVPEQPDEQTLKAWAVRALEAYREG
jgi:hypothetical protein